jgi:glycosyltransferase involved in cell wall biosynthesis
MMEKDKTALAPKVIISVNTTWNLVNFRSGLISALIKSGYEVVAIAPSDHYVKRLLVLGCRFVDLPMDNKGKHLGRDLKLLFGFYRVLKAERPNIFLGFTAKPNIYGAFAAHTLGIPVINNIAGLGSVFINVNYLTRIVTNLYRVALRRSSKVFFQNNEDLHLFVSGGVVSEAVADRLPGSGIDLKKFTTCPLPSRPIVRFLLVARILWDKGVGEFVEAARMLKQRGVNAECCLLGFLDVQNPAAISQKQMDNWVNEGVVLYLGVSDNVRNDIAQADCIVLPSFYREGTPRALLEAAAMARPIITTDSVGCRDVVDNGVSGYLCIPRDASDLAEKMGRIVSMSNAERVAMGMRGRKKVEQEFDEQIVIKKYLQAIQEVLSK